MKIRKAVIPAAGLGTRFLPASKAIPKEMFPIVDKPAIQYVVEEAAEAGIDEIAIVVASSKRAIVEHFNRSFQLERLLREQQKMDLLQEMESIYASRQIQYIYQEEPKGLGHAVWCARKFAGEEPFAVLLGDMLVMDNSLERMMQVFEQKQRSVIGVQEVPAAEVSKYGIIAGKMLSEKLYEITNVVEKPSPEAAPSHVAIQGRYIFTPKIFGILSRQPAGAGNEIQLTDAIAELKKSEAVYGSVIQGEVHDIGSRIGFIQANVHLALQREDISESILGRLEELVSERTSRIRGREKK